MRKTLYVIIALSVAANAFAALENLDELFARKTRFATATWDKSFLESTPAYLWQPETMMYTDVATGNEVWRITNTKEVKNTLPDISFAMWSADGKRFSFGSARDTSACVSSYETSDNATYQGSVMMMRADGSFLRPADNAPFEVFVHSRYLHWSPTEPDTYYGFGRNFAGEGLQTDQLYKVTVGDTNITKQMVFDFNTGFEMGMKKGFSSDGKKLNVAGGGKYFITDIGSSVTVQDPDGWAISRQLDPYWGNTYDTPAYTMHDEFLVGLGSNAKIYFIPEGKSSFWRYSLSGSDTDGGPKHTQDHDAPYNWGGEIEPVLTGFASGGTCTDPLYRSPWNCDSDSTTGPDQFMSHPSFDRWGHYVAGINSQQTRGWGVWDLTTHSWKAQKIPATTYDWHTDWEAWSDYFAVSPAGSYATDNHIYVSKYDGTDTRNIASTHAKELGSTSYNAIPRVTQSPDGTKAVFHGDFLYNTPDKYDIFYAVAYYPHAPEITSVTGAGTYTIRFDWRLGTANPRGYTQRGWPDEAINEPPPPRETRLFRLWRSSTGAVGSWEPIAEVPSNIFSRYNFSTGTWTGNDYWTINDTPGAGTFYYAVTSQEWSGLASRALSNVFSTAGIQTAAYPADPGAKVPFTTAFQEGIIRGWNVYASDTGVPAAIQQNKVATIPTASPKEYIDWLANPTATTYYTVVALDSQGFESAPLTITMTPSLSGVAGRNKITWTSEVDPTPDPVCGDAGSPGLCTAEGDCTAVGFHWCSGACQIDACPVLPSGAYPAYVIPGAGALSVGGKIGVTN